MFNNLHIGDVRRKFFTKRESLWNALVRSVTAWLELRGWFTTDPKKCKDFPPDWFKGGL